MVGIVIVAHSAALAQAVLKLAEQIAQGEVPLVACGGIDDPRNPYGTDATQVRDAIESVFGADGVVVLMDVGSSLLSAEMAVEFLPEDKRSSIKLCDAPLVEGAIAAAVCSKAGAPLADVVNEAQGALSLSGPPRLMQMAAPVIDRLLTAKEAQTVNVIHGRARGGGG